MFGRRAAVAVTTLAVTALGGGVALASTHGSQSKTQHHLRSAKPMSALVKVHVCHPGRNGSMLDSLQ